MHGSTTETTYIRSMSYFLSNDKRETVSRFDLALVPMVEQTLYILDFDVTRTRTFL